MSEVKRFYQSVEYKDAAHMKEHPEGEYVLYSDYEKLKAQLERAEVALKKTISTAEFFSRYADCTRDTWACKCEFCRDTTSTKNLREAREYFKENNKGERNE